MEREVIIALDFPNKKDTLDFLGNFKNVKPYVKLGMEIYYGEGPELVREIKNMGFKIFLDLKLHDIPNTVYKAMLNLADLKVDMVNVHAAGGKEMMAAAKRALVEKGAETKLLAVTILTSLTDEVVKEELWVDHSANETARHYAKCAIEAGCDGIICSPLEVPSINEACGGNVLTVTPGVRFAGGDKGDQKRVTTPSGANKLGSTFVVMGRPITKAEDPEAAYLLASKQFKEGEE